MVGTHELDDPSVRQRPETREPFAPTEIESFDIRDLDPESRKPPVVSKHQMRVRVAVYVTVILAVVLWFALKVAGMLN